MTTVSNLWRHPIKGVGREQLQSVALEIGKCIPMDRHWAIAHDAAKINPTNPEWARCMNFARGARGPELMAVASNYNETTRQITLEHPNLETITINPDDAKDVQTLIDWVTKISNPDRALPASIYKAGRGMTDSSEQTVSIHANASLAELAKTMGTNLEQERFRGNIWLDGPSAWSEFDWVGKSIRIGTAEFNIIDRIERCVATTVNPATGKVDADTLGTLNGTYNHQDFGVFGVVSKAGIINIGDKMELA